jgi:hypothetical protein
MAAARPRTSLAPRQREGVSRKTEIHGHSLEPPAPAGREHAALTEVRVGVIGRGQAGKSVLFHALADSLAGDFFPSGLHADVGDPREVARLIRDGEEARRLLRRCGLPATRRASRTRWYLYDGDEPRAVCKIREVIGQLLTHTLPDSAAELQAGYEDYLNNLVDAQVLWVLTPCPPPHADGRDRRRYANDLRVALAYLRQVLRMRPRQQPVAVALALSKIDALFDSADAARAALTDGVLLDALGPLVSLVEESKRVAEAVIAPVTAFGFGNAVRSEEGSGPEETADDPFGGEPVWLLRGDATPQPFNLNGLFLWTLLAGLLQAADPGVLDADSGLGGACRALRDDLVASDPWLVVVKGGPKPERRARRATTA